MSLVELLRTKSSEYELLAEWHAERAPLDDEHFVACQAMAVVGIVLREVAQAIDGDANQLLAAEREGARAGSPPESSSLLTHGHDHDGTRCMVGALLTH